MRHRHFTALLALTLSAAASPQVSAPDGPAGMGRIPSNAIAAGPLESSPDWKWEHDHKTSGESNGTSRYPTSPDGQSGPAGREFVATYAQKGGERYHLDFGRDATATHFVYEANIYLADPAQIADIEMDLNQVMSDGRTVIFGTQCASKSGRWEYTSVNPGGFPWRSSSIRCNPQKWSKKQWHKVQIASHRDSGGNVTYDWIGFDGEYTNFEGAAVFSAHELGWRPGVLLLNFQINGATGSGTVDAYVNGLTVYRW